MIFGGLQKKRVFLKSSLDRQYEAEKQQWLIDHPGVAPSEYEQAIRKIAERLGY